MFDTPPPHHCLTLIGHEKAKEQLQESYLSGRMHHAWLITGPEGIGKASLAYLAAHMILSGGENKIAQINPQHPASRLIVAESHPDLFVMKRPTDEKTGVLKDSIAVDDARKLAPFLSLTSSYGHGRVAIIDEAHALNRNGQNAILKSIEEPPNGTTILMTATTIGALLPTIRSRCRVLTMAPVPPEQLRVTLARLGLDLPTGGQGERLLAMAQGSVGRAIRLITNDVLPLYDEWLELVAAMPQINLARAHKLADMVGKKADSEAFLLLTDMIVDTLAHAVRAAALGQNDPTGLASKWQASGRLDKALQLWENTRQCFAQTEGANLDRKLAFINALSTMSREAL